MAETDSTDFEQEIGLGLWEVVAGGRLTREIRDVAKFRAAVGDELLIGLVQLFIAVNRLDGLLVAIDLTARAAPATADGRPAHNPESIAAERSRIVLVNMTWGTLHELMQAVEKLKSAHLTEVLSRAGDSEAIASWKIIRKAASEWCDDLGKRARNQLAFHLGDASVIRDGLDAWPADAPLTFSTSDETQSRAGMQVHIGFDLLCRGLNLSTEDFGALTDRGIKHRNLGTNAMLVFFGVLHAKGARIPSATVLHRLDQEFGAKRGRRNSPDGST